MLPSSTCFLCATAGQFDVRRRWPPARDRALRAASSRGSGVRSPRPAEWIEPSRRPCEHLAVRRGIADSWRRVTHNWERAIAARPRRLGDLPQRVRPTSWIDLGARRRASRRCGATRELHDGSLRDRRRLGLGRRCTVQQQAHVVAGRALGRPRVASQAATPDDRARREDGSRTTCKVLRSPRRGRLRLRRIFARRQRSRR